MLNLLEVNPNLLVRIFNNTISDHENKKMVIMRISRS